MLNFGFDRIRFFGEIFGPPRFCVNCVNRPPGYAAVRHQASELQNTEWHQVPLGNKPAGLKRWTLQHELFSQLLSGTGIRTHDCLSTNFIEFEPINFTILSVYCVCHQLLPAICQKSPSLCAKCNFYLCPFTIGISENRTVSLVGHLPILWVQFKHSNSLWFLVWDSWC